MRDQLLGDRLWAERMGGNPLARHLAPFAASLEDEGYSPSTVRSKLRLLSELGRWLGRSELEAAALEEGLVGAFLEELRRGGRSARSHTTTARQFLDHLRKHDVVPAPPPPVCAQTPLICLLGQYEKYLRAERGLTTATVANYLPVVRRFLTERFEEGLLPLRLLPLRELAPADGSQFILRHADSLSAGRAKLLVTALRSFFRFLLQHGHIDLDLAASVPTVAHWRLSTVPRYLGAEEVERLLGSCDRTTATGRRNYAVLLLLARLGLRAGEVVALELDDIDWRAGEILVRGKGLFHDRLPLPREVGESLAAYLHADRPPGPTRRVFLCRKAPRRGFAGASTVGTIVRRALTQADLNPSTKGAHLLRHSLATGMLNREATLAEVGELLRHRSSNTTEIYAKVDFRALRLLAQPWPGDGGQR